MATILIGFFTGVILCKMFYDEEGGVIKVIAHIGFGIIFAGIALALTAIISGVVVPDSECIFTSKVQKIVTLKDNQETGPSYLIKGGSDYLYYATETERGSQINRLDASRIHFQEDDKNPRIQTLSRADFKHWYTWLYAIPFSRGDNTVYIPKGAAGIAYEPTFY